MAEFDVFLSHNNKDKPVVRQLAEALKSRGLSVWLDEWELPPGRPWQEALEGILETARTAAVLVGEHGLGKWEVPEMRAAVDEFVRRRSPVIPVLLPDAPEQPELPLLVRGFTWVDFRSDGITDSTLDRLEWGITGRKPRRETSTPQVTAAEERAEGLEDLTVYARHRMAEIASQWLAQECDPFVMPAVARRVTRPERMMPREEAASWHELSDDESRRLVLGELPENQNRVRIFSQSGTGKTTLLHYCEQEISQTDDGRVPVRVSALSSFDWRGDVIKSIANRLLHAFLPAGTDETSRVAWLKHLIHARRVVFLFDAVDQTDDQLAGFAQFMEGVDVRACPVLVTGRPEVEQTRAAVFREARWDTCRVEPFDEMRIREYLGDLSDELLSGEHEAFLDNASYQRKQQWVDLLQVPLLLRMLRQLAGAERDPSSEVSLAGLHNRHALYREAVHHLVAKGWESLVQTPMQRDLLDHAEVKEYLVEMAWTMVSDNNFTSIFQGKRFRRWRSENRNVVQALSQVDVTTRHSVLDNPGELSLAWRHLSFCEYFAGLAFAELERDEQDRIVREHGRNPSWQWVFRFALAELQADDNRDACSRLARGLVRTGSPFLVYDAICDGIKVGDRLEVLCRWLVHRDWSIQRDYTEAWSSDRQRPEVDSEALTLLEALFDRQSRDSRFLHPAWELLESSSDPRAGEIRERYLAEFDELTAGAGDARATAHSLNVDEHFLACPPMSQRRRTYKIGENADRSVKVKRFHLSKAPITNVQFELFDPAHKEWRDQYSPDDDSPALYVSWYMAVMFCTWLGEEYRLPTEEEWEVACRAGTTTQYWWGNEFLEEKCNSWETEVRRATPADSAHANDWGIMEMCGNVWEWCQEETGRGRHVLRGGAWNLSADDCCCYSRLVNYPVTRSDVVGVRVARTYP